MEPINIDPNEVILVKTFFNHPGWAKFENKIIDLEQVVDSKIKIMLIGDKAFNQEDLNELNFKKAKLRAYLEVRAIRDEMLEEVDPEYGKEPEEKSGFEVKNLYDNSK